MAISTSSTFNPVLSALAHEWWNQGMSWAGHILAPVFRTGEQAAKYPVFSKDNFMRRPKHIVRAPGTEYTHSGLKLSDTTYNCEDKGHKVAVDDTERKKYRNQFDADQAAIMRAVSVVRYNHELEVKALTEAGGVPSSSPSTKWDAASGSTPIADIDAVRKAFRDGAGLEPNTMVLTRDVADVLLRHADLIDLVKYSRVGVLGAEDLARFFRIPRVVIAGEYHDTAEEGLASSIAQIWGDNVIFSYTFDAQDLEAPNFARTFVWTEDSGMAEDIDLVIESYREDKIRSDWHQVRHNTDVKTTGAGLIRTLTNVLT